MAPTTIHTAPPPPSEEVAGAGSAWRSLGEPTSGFVGVVEARVVVAVVGTGAAGAAVVGATVVGGVVVGGVVEAADVVGGAFSDGARVEAVVGGAGAGWVVGGAAGVTGGTGACAATGGSRAGPFAHVTGPTIPSVATSAARWKRRTARAVRGP